MIGVGTCEAIIKNNIVIMILLVVSGKKYQVMFKL